MSKTPKFPLVVLAVFLAVGVATMAAFCQGEDGDPEALFQVAHATTSTTIATTSTTQSTTTTTAPPPRPSTTRPRTSRNATEPRLALPPTTAPIVAEVDVWLVLADCESGDGDVGPPFSYNLRAVGNDVYGAFQFAMSTWRGAKAKDDPADPRDASWAAQTAAAQRIGLRESQFPSCYRRMRSAGYV